jgi:hypothetical protein
MPHKHLSPKLQPQITEVNIHWSHPQSPISAICVSVAPELAKLRMAHFIGGFGPSAEREKDSCNCLAPPHTLNDGGCAVKGT